MCDCSVVLSHVRAKHMIFRPDKDLKISYVYYQHLSLINERDEY